MSGSVGWREDTIEVAGRVGCWSGAAGRARRSSNLHSFGGIERMGDFMDLLAGDREVIQPVHPGWPGSDGPELIDTPIDMALHLGDLVRQLRLAPGWWASSPPPTPCDRRSPRRSGRCASSGSATSSC